MEDGQANLISCITEHVTGNANRSWSLLVTNLFSFVTLYLWLPQALPGGKLLHSIKKGGATCNLSSILLHPSLAFEKQRVSSCRLKSINMEASTTATPGIISPAEHTSPSTSPTKPKSRFTIRNPFARRGDSDESNKTPNSTASNRARKEEAVATPSSSSSEYSNDSNKAESSTADTAAAEVEEKLFFFGVAVTLSSLPDNHRQAFIELREQIAEASPEDNR